MFCSRVQILHFKCSSPPPFSSWYPGCSGLPLLCCLPESSTTKTGNCHQHLSHPDHCITVPFPLLCFQTPAQHFCPHPWWAVIFLLLFKLVLLYSTCVFALFEKKGEITQTCFRLSCQEFDLLPPFPALLAFRYWLMQQHGPFIWVSGATVIIFRSELSILLGIILLLEIGGRRLGVWRAVGHIVPAGAVWLSR